MSRTIALSSKGTGRYWGLHTQSEDLKKWGYTLLATLPESLANEWGMIGARRAGGDVWIEWVDEAVARWNAHQSGASLDPIQVKPGPRKPPPQVCPEVWQQAKPDPERAMSAVREFCKGGA